MSRASCSHCMPRVCALHSSGRAVCNAPRHRYPAERGQCIAIADARGRRVCRWALYGESEHHLWAAEQLQLVATAQKAVRRRRRGAVRLVIEHACDYNSLEGEQNTCEGCLHLPMSTVRLGEPAVMTRRHHLAGQHSSESLATNKIDSGGPMGTHRQWISTRFRCDVQVRPLAMPAGKHRRHQPSQGTIHATNSTYLNLSRSQASCCPVQRSRLLMEVRSRGCATWNRTC